MYIERELTSRQQFSLVCTLINNNKLAYQIATLLPITVKKWYRRKAASQAPKKLIYA